MAVMNAVRWFTGNDAFSLIFEIKHQLADLGLGRGEIPQLARPCGPRLALGCKRIACFEEQEHHNFQRLEDL